MRACITKDKKRLMPQNYKVIIFIKSNVINVKRAESTSTNNLIPLGAGSYALTYKYHDDFYDKNFVVKKAKKDLSAKELERFKQEFQIMKNLNSPYIVDVYSYNEKENSYIILEDTMFYHHP